MLKNKLLQNRIVKNILRMNREEFIAKNNDKEANSSDSETN